MRPLLVLLTAMPLVVRGSDQLIATDDGTTWQYELTEEAGTKFAFVGEEDVDVPAGKFRAFHIHGEQSKPVSMTIDRWFANGVGIVQDITVTKTMDGNLLRRITLQLKELPKIAPRPAVKPLPTP